jgi:hypothetical protein
VVALLQAGTGTCPYKFSVLFAIFAVKNVWIPVFTGMTRNARPRQLYFFNTSRAMTMRITSEAPSVIIRLR